MASKTNTLLVQMYFLKKKRNEDKDLGPLFRVTLLCLVCGLNFSRLADKSPKASLCVQLGTQYTEIVDTFNQPSQNFSGQGGGRVVVLSAMWQQPLTGA